MSERPNILLIVTDEQRLSECGCYGDTPCMTPNLDRLAKESHIFEYAYTACPLCSPARGSIQTGLYPHSHGVTCNCQDLGCNVPELNDSPGLLSRVLGANGYSCGFNGKWHLGTSHGRFLGSQREAALPSHFGYEGLDFPGHGGVGIQYPQFKEYLRENGLTMTIDPKDNMPPLPYGTWPEGEESGVPHFITDRTIALMEDFRQRGKPFFMDHNFWGPHQPYYAPESYLRMYDDVEIPQWPSFEMDPDRLHPFAKLRQLPGPNRTDWSAWERIIKHKYAFMTYIDHQIGRMLDYLEASGLAENTVVIFTADHGDNLGGHGGLLDKGFGHFEETHRIPLLVREPGGEGRRHSELVSQLDVYPTILKVAGADQPVPVHGRPLLGATLPEREYVVTEFHGLNSVTLSMRTIRCGKWKYGWTCCLDELYDLEQDPHEMNNLAGRAESREIIEELQFKLLDWMTETADPLKQQYERVIRNAKWSQ